jgi:negative regulator of flagellin synthesis FlgM
MKLDLMSEIQTGVSPASATKPVERPANGAAGAGRSASGTSASAAARGVTVTLSAQSQSLGGVQGSSNDVVDTGKVEAMKTAIANGSFKVNAEAIADKLLANASEMLTASRR